MTEGTSRATEQLEIEREKLSEKRYDLCNGQMLPVRLGDWMKVSDVVPLIKRLITSEADRDAALAREEADAATFKHVQLERDGAKVAAEILREALAKLIRKSSVFYPMLPSDLAEACAVFVRTKKDQQ